MKKEIKKAKTQAEQEELDMDDEGNCLYCGQKCWDGQMCDEQQAGGFNKEDVK